MANETPQGVWAEIGLALRLVQEVGAHRHRRRKDPTPTMEDELWKRAFWFAYLLLSLVLRSDISIRVIMSLDRHASSISGRPCGLQDEESVSIGKRQSKYLSSD